MAHLDAGDFGVRRVSAYPNEDANARGSRSRRFRAGAWLLLETGTRKAASTATRGSNDSDLWDHRSKLEVRRSREWIGEIVTPTRL